MPCQWLSLAGGGFERERLHDLFSIGNVGQQGGVGQQQFVSGGCSLVRPLASSFAIDPERAAKLKSAGVDDVKKDFAAADDSVDAVDCDWDAMELGNQPGIWKKDQPSMKYAYDHNLKGQEISVWWLGKTKKGECNDLTDNSRGCWYRSRMLNDVGCDAEKDHCLHYVPHDGMNRHNFTCPTWVRNAEGAPCKLPDGWQACPFKFKVQRVDGGVPQEFKGALLDMCPKGPGQEGKKMEQRIKLQLIAKLGNKGAEQVHEKLLQAAANGLQEAREQQAAGEPTASSSLAVSSTPFSSSFDGSADQDPAIMVEKLQTKNLSDQQLQAQKDLQAQLRSETRDEQATQLENASTARVIATDPHHQAVSTSGVEVPTVPIQKTAFEENAKGAGDEEKPLGNVLLEKAREGLKKRKEKELAEQAEFAKMTEFEKEMQKSVGKLPDEDNADEAIKSLDNEYRESVVGPKAFEAPEPAGHCHGSMGATDGIPGTDINMIFDVHNNDWYRCSQEMLCEDYFISKITKGAAARKCGDEICKPDQQCFEHFISSKRSKKECVPDEQVWVISDSDDKAKVEAAAMPVSMILIASLALPPPQSIWRSKSNRRWSQVDFL